MIAAHEFIEVGVRRWCVCCDLFQMKEKGAIFFPTPRSPCARTTPYARNKTDGQGVIMSEGTDDGW
jgi:hypothetical protein